MEEVKVRAVSRNGVIVSDMSRTMTRLEVLANDWIVGYLWATPPDAPARVNLVDECGRRHPGMYALMAPDAIAQDVVEWGMGDAGMRDDAREADVSPDALTQAVAEALEQSLADLAGAGRGSLRDYYTLAGLRGAVGLYRIQTPSGYRLLTPEGYQPATPEEVALHLAEYLDSYADNPPASGRWSVLR